MVGLERPLCRCGGRTPGAGNGRSTRHIPVLPERQVLDDQIVAGMRDCSDGECQEDDEQAKHGGQGFSFRAGDLKP